MERDLNGVVVEPKRLFSYHWLNRNPIVSIFFGNGALLGQLHVELRHITYWPDNLLTCILKILVQLFEQSLDQVNKPVTQQYMFLLIFQKGKK